MQIQQDTLDIQRDASGYFYFTEEDTRVILYLSEELFPDDDSVDKLKYICQTFPVDGRIIGLPDLHFKIKNFVPSGMTIPLRDRFSPKLLGPNNDGMGAIRFSTSRPLTESEITAVFGHLKQRIVMFRRSESVVSEDVLEDIFLNGITGLIDRWGFQEGDLPAFEDGGCSMHFDHIDQVRNAFPAERSPSLPDFVPGHDLFERGVRCLGVLDGTSHFIELFRHEESIKDESEQALDIKPGEYFFLIHAGSGDVGLIAHRAYLNQNGNLYDPHTEIGERAYRAFMVAGNYGFANRLFIYREIKAVLEAALPALESIEFLSDCPHDYLAVEDGSRRFIHRKGSVRLAPGNEYSEGHPWHKTGSPYLFPSTVGGDAYIVSNRGGNSDALHSASHGAGRLIKKDQAIEKYRDVHFESALQNQILLFRYGVDTIEGQHPKAFKDIGEIMRLFERFNLAQPISRLVPLASLKA